MFIYVRKVFQTHFINKQSYLFTLFLDMEERPWTIGIIAGGTIYVDT